MDDSPDRVVACDEHRSDRRVLTRRDAVEMMTGTVRRAASRSAWLSRSAAAAAASVSCCAVR
jgi:hypothetical protein